MEHIKSILFILACLYTMVVQDADAASFCDQFKATNKAEYQQCYDKTVDRLHSNVYKQIEQLSSMLTEDQKWELEGYVKEIPRGLDECENLNCQHDLLVRIYLDLKKQIYFAQRKGQGKYNEPALVQKCEALVDYRDLMPAISCYSNEYRLLKEASSREYSEYVRQHGQVAVHDYTRRIVNTGCNHPVFSACEYTAYTLMLNEFRAMKPTSFKKGLAQ